MFYLFYHFLDIKEYVIVFESDDSVSEFPEFGLSQRIVFHLDGLSMVSAINLNDKIGLKTDKIDDIVFDDILPLKLFPQSSIP